MSDGRTCALVICIALALLPLGTLVGPPCAPVGPERVAPAQEVPTAQPDAAALLSGLEPRFTENLGQLGAAGGDFYARGEPLSVALGTGWMAYDVLDDEGRTLVKMTFPGAREVAPAGAVPLDHTSSFFRGPDPERWVSGARSYERVVYESLWDGIDLVFRFSDGLLKYDLVLAPGADASDVAVRYEGATDLSVDPATGDLLIGTHSRPLRDLAPTANQVVSGESVEVTVDLRLVDATTVGLVVGDHDGDVPLVIDPGLVFGTYVGGADSEFYVQGKVDGEGCVYVGGSTDSMDFPTTPGAFKRSKIEWVTDAFVFKLSADGSALVYSTYIGSDEEMGLDYFNDIAVDAEGCAYITGSTYFGYPTTAGAFSRTVNGSDTDTFLTKLSKDGTSLEYSTYFGGPQGDKGLALAVDASGCAWVAGYTWSAIPFSEDAFDTTVGGNIDAYLVKFNDDGSDFEYSTLYGGDGKDFVYDLFIDSDGLPYIVGETKSSDLPTSTNAYDRTYNGVVDIMLVKFTYDLSDLEYATYVGTSYSEVGVNIVVDEDGYATITGKTNSDTFPTTAGAYNRTFVGPPGQAALEATFILRMDPQGSALNFSTYIARGSGAVLAVSGDRIYIAMTAVAGFLPISPDAYDTTPVGYQNAALVQLDANGTRLLYSTYIGGDGSPAFRSIHVDDNGTITWIGLGGLTCDTTEGAYCQTSNGELDVYVARLDLSKPMILEDSSDVVATTGDSFRLRVRVADGQGVANVTAEYWYSGDKDHRTATLVNETPDATDGNWTALVVTPSDTVGPMFYAFHASDTAGNLNLTLERTVNVVDNDAPSVLGTKTTGATTGDRVVLYADIHDNIGFGLVYVNYWLGDTPSEAVNASMEAFETSGWGNGTWFQPDVFYPNDTLEPLYFFVDLVDRAGNWNRSETFRVDARDDDAPLLVEDLTPANGTTGDPLTFEAVVWDNIGVEAVWVAYRYGTASLVNLSLAPSGDDVWNATEQLFHTLTDIHYRIGAADAAGNVNWTPWRIIGISDNDLPEIVADGTSGVATTGDPFTFFVSVQDNIAVSSSSVSVVYSLAGGDDIIISLDLVDTPLESPYDFATVVIVPTDARDVIVYHFLVRDFPGNVLQGPTGTVAIVDDDAPTIVYEHTTNEAVKGHDLPLVVEVDDNIGVEGVYMVYRYGEGAPVNETLVGDGVLSIPRQPGGDLRFHLSAVDGAGNWNTTGEYTVSLVNRPPVLSDLPTWSVTEGEEASFDLSSYLSDANDNIASLTVECSDAAVTVDGLVLRVLHDAWVPERTVTLTASDGEDSAHATLTIVITNVNDPPIIKGIQPENGTEVPKGRWLILSVTVEDEDGDELTITWRDGDEVLGMVSPLEVRLEPGKHTITVAVDDGTVVVEDSIVVRVTGGEDGIGPGIVWIVLTVIVIALVVSVAVWYTRRQRLEGPGDQVSGPGT